MILSRLFLVLNNKATHTSLKTLAPTSTSQCLLLLLCLCMQFHFRQLGSRQLLLPETPHHHLPFLSLKKYHIFQLLHFPLYPIKKLPLFLQELLLMIQALLLVGFKVEESDKIHQMLRDLEGEFMQVIYCTEDMLTRSVWDAVHTGKQNLENIKIARSVPRICFLSGLTGEETMMFMDAFSESDVEPAIFAAMVPNSANKPLEEVIDEIKGDHEMVTAAAKQPGI